MTDPDTLRIDDEEIVEAILQETPDAAIVANLGVASWVLARIRDRERNFYMDGGMGGTTPTGMGIALRTDEDVVVLDGDGSMLMSMGCLSTVGAYGPDNLTIVVRDNGVYGTTGGQSNASANVDFAGVAESCGIQSERASTPEEFESTFREAVNRPGPSLIECRVTPISIGPPDDFVPYEYSHSYAAHRFRSVIGIE
ncbi:sulfopyruvate decarboxylase subunit beta (plasmid) [Salinigranum rubrum]|uniref:sulfopyruvate decarboxylase n=1 Tax=Salinigranum rubrum TaxID=755307 RepID=A0A2I8VRX6_9EURY|nr:thiamine pyrophosphate-dependent enzyme [Salinigranum rubrum]AUV84663.1 sulfopyruvate decarboxylase subunit beta [Salinigranum rubrum]